MKKILQQLLDHQVLSRSEAREAMLLLSEGQCNRSEAAVFIAVYLMRSILPDELFGFRDALLELCVPVNLGGIPVTDLCGTGGDGKNTFNISTLAVFVVAASGGKVAKHGNYGVSSVSGSSNVMEYFGYRFTNNETTIKNELEKTGVCFLHAPLFHPALKQVAEVRKEIGLKTFFNMLGPLVNPSRPQNQLIGVFNPGLARLYHYLCQQQKLNYTIVHSFDGYDEVSLTGPVKIYSNTLDAVYEPADFGATPLLAADLYGGTTVEEAAKLFKNIIEGQGTKAQNEVVIVNAALALTCAGVAADFNAAKELASVALLSGNAGRKFNQLLELNKKTLS